MCYTNEIYIFLINYIATNLSFSRKNFNRDKNLDGTFGYHSDYLSIEVNFAIIAIIFCKEMIIRILALIYGYYL